MRILHVLNHTWRLNGNVHAAVDLACAQAALGYQVAIASGGGSFDAIFAKSGVEQLILDQRRKPLVIAKAAFALSAIVRQRQFDVVHAHMVTSALLCRAACSLVGVPLVTTVHNEFESSAIVMGVGTRVIAVSTSVGNAMRRRGIPESRLRVVLNGTIGSARFAAPPCPPAALGSPAVLFVGGLHPRKGVLDLLRAFETAFSALPNARLHIVGEGPFGDEYRRTAATMTCGGAVTFHGGQADPRPFLNGADVLVVPSHAEPAGLVISEAREAGCAVIGSDVGGIPEMLEGGGAGLLTPPRDPARLADAIISVIRDPNVMSEWKRKGQTRIDRMSVWRVASETLDVYSECVARRDNRRPS